MTTDDGASLAQGRVHFSVRQEVAKSDADLVCEAFNAGPARWLTEWNFPGAAIPRVYRDFEETEDLDKAVTRDRMLMDMGFEPDEDYIRETYGKHWTRKTPPANGQADPAGPPLAAFAEPHVAADAIDGAAAAMLAEWEQLVEPAIAQIEAAAEAASSYEDFAARLLAAVPSLDVSALTEAVARARFAARAAGLAGETLSEAEDDA